MIIEHALLSIQAGRQTEFEQAFPAARAVISRATGFLALHLQRSIDDDAAAPTTRYLLLIHWQTLKDHTIGFRQSDLFGQWRAVIGPFFDKPPVVEHYQPVPILNSIT